jgi:glycosyltransferase involved in cell wall biosynthesis
MDQKIGIITHNFPESRDDRKNAGIFVYDIAEELSKSSKIWIFCPREKKSNSEKIGSLNVFWFESGVEKLGSVNLLNPLGLINLSAFFLRGVLKVPLFMKESKPDFIIAMWAWPSGFFAYLIKLFYRKPYVVWALGSDINKYAKMPLMKLVFKQILVKAEILFADGIELQKDVAKFSGRKCIFLASSTKMEFKLRKKAKKNEKIVLTFLGRMEAVKGPDIFLDALVLIKDKLDGFQINFVGDGSMFSQLKQMARDNGLEDKICFYESDRRRNMRLLAESDWVVIPSRSDSIPLVFSEAMKVGTPVICSNLPDISYIVNKYKVGFLYNKDSTRNFAKTLAELVFKDKERKFFEKNTKLAAKEFSVEESAKKLYNYVVRSK